MRDAAEKLKSVVPGAADFKENENLPMSLPCPPGLVLKKGKITAALTNQL
jgi:hypothetical protein